MYEGYTFYTQLRFRTVLAITAGILSIGIGGAFLISGCCERQETPQLSSTEYMQERADFNFREATGGGGFAPRTYHASLATMYDVRLLRQEIQTLNSNMVYLIELQQHNNH